MNYRLYHGNADLLGSMRRPNLSTGMCSMSWPNLTEDTKWLMPSAQIFPDVHVC